MTIAPIKKKHPKAKKLAPVALPENTKWKRAGIVTVPEGITGTTECILWFRFVNGRRIEKLVPAKFEITSVGFTETHRKEIPE
jgi:hypothetical protein